MFRTFAAAVLAALPAPAQGAQWVVDQANGPGAHFVDLAAAVAAVADGDTLLVRAGRYDGFTTSKGLTILGDGAVVIDQPFANFSASSVRVDNLPAGRSFVMKRVDVLAPYSSFIAAIELDSTVGSVHLEDVNAYVTGQPLGAGFGLWARGAAYVTATGCSFLGRPAVWVDGSSHVTLVDSTATGVNACGSLRCLTFGAAVGLSAYSSVVQLVATPVRGGDGAVPWGSPFPQQPAPAIQLYYSELIVCGDATSSILAGSLGGGNATDAIFATGGSVLIDPAVPVVGSQGGSPISAGVPVTTRALPCLVADGDPPGGVATVDLTTAPGNPVLLVLGLPAPPLATPFGYMVFAPATTATLFSGLQPASGALSISLGVPNDSNLRGRAFVVQGAVYDIASSLIDLVNGATFVLH